MKDKWKDKWQSDKYISKKKKARITPFYCFRTYLLFVLQQCDAMKDLQQVGHSSKG